MWKWPICSYLSKPYPGKPLPHAYKSPPPTTSRSADIYCPCSQRKLSTSLKAHTITCRASNLFSQSWNSWDWTSLFWVQGSKEKCQRFLAYMMMAQLTLGHGGSTQYFRADFKHTLLFPQFALKHTPCNMHFWTVRPRTEFSDPNPPKSFWIFFLVPILGVGGRAGCRIVGFGFRVDDCMEAIQIWKKA